MILVGYKKKNLLSTLIKNIPYPYISTVSFPCNTGDYGCTLHEYKAIDEKSRKP